MTSPNRIPVMSETLRATIDGLSAGLGVEDIAVRTGHNVEQPRFHVRALRARGVLAKVLAGEAVL